VIFRFPWPVVFIHYPVMTENTTSMDSPAPASGGAFPKLFGTGVTGWLVGMVILYGAAWMFAEPETASVALLWMISHSWIAFLLGLLLMVIRGLMISRGSLAGPLVAYLLPAALLAALAAISLAVYPDTTLRSDLLTYLPVVLVFYVAGWLWMVLRGARADGPALMRAVIPSLVGGLVIYGMIALPAFAGDDFRYRTAFELKTQSKSIQDGVFVYEGTLKIMKPGNYQFSAPRYIYAMEESAEEDVDLELGDIQWGTAGAPGNGGQGSFPLRIVWKQSILPIHTIEMLSYGDAITLEVRDSDQADRLVYTIIAETADGP